MRLIRDIIVALIGIILICLLLRNFFGISIDLPALAHTVANEIKLLFTGD